MWLNEMFDIEAKKSTKVFLTFYLDCSASFCLCLILINIKKQQPFQCVIECNVTLAVPVVNPVCQMLGVFCNFNTGALFMHSTLIFLYKIVLYSEFHLTAKASFTCH